MNAIEPISGPAIWLALFAIAQILYGLTFLVDLYLFTRPVNLVSSATAPPDDESPRILLLYPVLHELEETMRTTFTALSRLDYPKDRWSVTAIPNADDPATIASLERLRAEFDFLTIMEIPPTSHPSWDIVWKDWDQNPHAYWWREGKFAHNRNLPPKKTRQMVYALYHALEDAPQGEDFLIDYIDADSCPPPDHFRAGAAGMLTHDVIQAENVAGNLNASLAASWHAFDHMAWDGRKYRHLTANGKHPYWILGKGVFFRARDLQRLGGFHPWLAIEDPEVGMRFWAAGKKLAVVRAPLIEEVPLTFARGITQRKRWVCGFLQSLSLPLTEFKLSMSQTMKAWMNFLPCASLWVNALGFPTGIWALTYGANNAAIPPWLFWLSLINITAFVLTMIGLYISTWHRTALVLTRTSDRLSYMLKVNPLFLMIWWVVWLVPIWLGFWMYMRDGGLIWERTEKVNANEALIRSEQAPAISGS
ncbi:glycosyltransferase family 2 protein [Brevundimonas sp. NPDC090276]|uniref:glycosyltransferase family 2 protein n=1 Tax=Brevundimonas sp. NPDC090276 TaxID=3363956 RepID=UPI00383B91F5